MGAAQARDDDDDGSDFSRLGVPRCHGRAATWAEVGERLRSFSSSGARGRAVHFSLRSDPRGDGGLLQVTTLDPHGHGLLSAERRVGIDDPLRQTFAADGAFDWADGEGGRLVELIAGLGIAREEARRGWAMPIHGPGRTQGLFAVTSARGDPLDGDVHRRLLEPWLSVFGWEFHGSVVTLLDRAEAAGRHLPPREIAVLAAAAAGRTARETAVELGLSPETVESYLRDAVRRLGCINKTHAVAVAVRCGMI
jgi:DNA-binding CsgD family transcriptional regulator